MTTGPGVRFQIHAVVRIVVDALPDRCPGLFSDLIVKSFGSEVIWIAGGGEHRSLRSWAQLFRKTCLWSLSHLSTWQGGVVVFARRHIIGCLSRLVDDRQAQASFITCPVKARALLISGDVSQRVIGPWPVTWAGLIYKLSQSHVAIGRWSMFFKMSQFWTFSQPHIQANL